MDNVSDPPSPKPRILVVDDSPDVAMTMMMLLKAFGYEVAQAHNGAAAIEAARQQRPGIVFLDIGLPDMSGYEVAQRLRTEVGLEQTALVAVSGFDEDEDRLQNSAFNRHLVKPVSIQTLKQLLSELTASTPNRAGS